MDSERLKNLPSVTGWGERVDLVSCAASVASSVNSEKWPILEDLLQALQNDAVKRGKTAPFDWTDQGSGLAITAGSILHTTNNHRSDGTCDLIVEARRYLESLKLDADVSPKDNDKPRRRSRTLLAASSSVNWTVSQVEGSWRPSLSECCDVGRARYNRLLKISVNDNKSVKAFEWDEPTDIWEMFKVHNRNPNFFKFLLPTIPDGQKDQMLKMTKQRIKLLNRFLQLDVSPQAMAKIVGERTSPLVQGQSAKEDHDLRARAALALIYVVLKCNRRSILADFLKAGLKGKTSGLHTDYALKANAAEFQVTLEYAAAMLDKIHDAGKLDAIFINIHQTITKSCEKEGLSVKRTNSADSMSSESAASQ